MIEQLISGPMDMQWLKDVHMPDLPDNAKSAWMIGNEDAPNSIKVFDKVCPLITDAPIAQFPA